MPSINVKLTDEEFKWLKPIKEGGISWKRFLFKGAWIVGAAMKEPRREWGEGWKLDPAKKIEKPCHELGWCPYGQIVEAFPIEGGPRTDISCTVFGHDCPAFRCAEPLAE